MNGKKLVLAVAAAAAAIAMAAPAQADPVVPTTPSPPTDYDAPFKFTVNNFGIYGPQDQLAWIGKISCDRINRGLDNDPYKSANFIQHNLARGTTQGQAFQFLGAAIDHYCPDQVGFIQSAGAH
jgi:Protein of unknown function (DUF732)